MTFNIKQRRVSAQVFYIQDGTKFLLCNFKMLIDGITIYLNSFQCLSGSVTGSLELIKSTVYNID